MKETTVVVNSIDEAFRKGGFDRIPDHTSGRKYYTCNKCSKDRHGFNRSARCVGVNVDALGLRSFCNHCSDEQVFMLAEAVHSNSSSSNAQRGPGLGDRHQQKPKVNGYAVMQRAGRAQWSRR